MLAFTLQRIIEHLSEVPELTRLSREGDPTYPDRVLEWLTTVENDLLR